MTEPLFDVILEPSPDQPTRVRIVEYDDPEQDRRGPGPQPAPTEGRAPDWWRTEARAVVLRLAARPDGCTADDLREVLPEPVSASNAAVGSLFRGLAAEGLIRLVGYEQSKRPSSRGRVLGRWAV